MDTNHDDILTVKEIYDTPGEILKPFLGPGSEGEFVDSEPPEDEYKDEL